MEPNAQEVWDLYLEGAKSEAAETVTVALPAASERARLSDVDNMLSAQEQIQLWVGVIAFQLAFRLDQSVERPSQRDAVLATMSYSYICGVSDTLALTRVPPSDYESWLDVIKALAETST